MTKSVLITDRDGDAVEAVLPMPLPYVPVPAWLTGEIFSAVVLIPLYYICSAILRQVFRIKPPPRARFIIKPKVFRMELVSRATGERTIFECDPAKIREFRKNQYSEGLYVHVAGLTKSTFMEDYDDDEVESIASQVCDLLNSLPNVSLP